MHPAVLRISMGTSASATVIFDVLAHGPKIPGRVVLVVGLASVLRHILGALWHNWRLSRPKKLLGRPEMNRPTIDWPRAIGEFVIIVMGVLAALAVDEWRGDYNDRKTEVDYLARLRVDVGRDIERFSSEIELLEKKAGFLQSLLDKTVESQFSENPRALMEAKVYSSFRGLPDSVSTTFDELKSTGRLALIRDLEIRNAMSEYYSGYASTSAQVNQMQTGDYSRLILGLVSGEIAREWRLSGSISKPDEFLQSLMLLQEHPDLLMAANIEITYGTALQFYVIQFRDQARHLLDLLNKE
jgi:hypothetical protein